MGMFREMRSRIRRRPKNRKLTSLRRLFSRRRDKSSVLNIGKRSRRESRLRRAAQISLLLKSAAVVLVLGAFAVGVQKLMRRSFLDNPEFQLGNVQFLTNGTITKDAVLKEAGVRPDTNLLTINLDKIRERLIDLPRVKTANVARHLPDTLKIDIEERFAVAWISSASPLIHAHTTQGGYLVDEDGVVFECHSLLREYAGLPVISVRHLRGIEEGEPIDSDLVTAALEILRKGNDMLLVHGKSVVGVDAPTDYALNARFGDGSVATLGLDKIDRQLRRLVRALDDANEHGLLIAQINLIPEKNIPVSYFDRAVRPQVVDSVSNFRETRLTIPSVSEPINEVGELPTANSVADVVSPPRAIVNSPPRAADDKISAVDDSQEKQIKGILGGR